jgi:hypothetical protein
MFLSKIQVKNVIEKNLGKYRVSRLLKGRVLYYFTSGYELTEKENGFISVGYTISNASYLTYERDEQIRQMNLSKVQDLFLSLGFEFDGVDGYRKERKAK